MILNEAQAQLLSDFEKCDDIVNDVRLSGFSIKNTTTTENGYTYNHKKYYYKDEMCIYHVLKSNWTGPISIRKYKTTDKEWKQNEKI